MATDRPKIYPPFTHHTHESDSSSSSSALEGVGGGGGGNGGAEEEEERRVREDRCGLLLLLLLLLLPCATRCCLRGGVHACAYTRKKEEGRRHTKRTYIHNTHHTSRITHDRQRMFALLATEAQEREALEVCEFVFFKKN